MRKLIAGLLLSIGLASPALAQNFTAPPPAGVIINGYVVVASCGAQSLSNGLGYGTMDQTGTICTAGGGGGSSSNPFTPNGNYGTLTATAASSASTALPTGAVVAFQNTSAIDLSCVLSAGAATATTNKIILRAGASIFVTVGSNVNAACINQTGSASNVVVMAGGTGLGTNFGGSSAGGGAVTIADGADTAQGTTTDTACTVPTSATSCNEIKLLKTIADLANIPAQLKVNTTGGATPQSAISVNNVTAVVVKASAGTLYGAQLGNIGTVPLYLKIYNATSATCGSGTPVKRLLIPKAGTAADGGGSNITFGPMGIAFGTGITYCLTAAIADNDTTAPAANVALVNLDWN